MKQIAMVLFSTVKENQCNHCHRTTGRKKAEPAVIFKSLEFLIHCVQLGAFLEILMMCDCGASSDRDNQSHQKSFKKT